jgi:hypothetical protein
MAAAKCRSPARLGSRCRSGDLPQTDPGGRRPGLLSGIYATPSRFACRGRGAGASRSDGNSSHDFQIADQVSIFLIRPLTEAARQWLDENVVSEPWQWVQGALCVETRFARDLIIEIEEAGFEITR